MKMGDRFMYHDKAVYVLQTPKSDDNHVLIQDGGRQSRVPKAVLKQVPDGAHITTQHRIGKGTVIPKEIRTQYVQHKVKTGSGKSYAIDNNDDTANSLRGTSLEDTYTKAVEVLAGHGVESSVAALKAKYENLNPGMQRMNLGNLIRGAAKKAETQKRKDGEKAKRDEAKAAQAEAKAVKAQEKADAKAAKDAAKQAAAEAAQTPEPTPAVASEPTPAVASEPTPAVASEPTADATPAPKRSRRKAQASAEA